MVNVPPPLKSIGMYLKLATEHEKRDPIVSYYCRLYAVQKGMEIDRRSPECKQFLMQMMDLLDSSKKAMGNCDQITNETLGQIYLEEYAMKLFMFADKKDRAGDFSQATVKSFYSAGILMDVVSGVGEPQDELEKCRKYAKWKALYITQCLKNGETPIAGPLNEEGAMEAPDLSNYNFSDNAPPASSSAFSGGAASSYTPHQPAPAASPYNPPAVSASSASPKHAPQPTSSASGSLTSDDYTLAEKYSKYATSALQFQDATTAVDYLQKALQVLMK